ncbi:hypothetical protein [Rhodoflexus sp.]
MKNSFIIYVATIILLSATVISLNSCQTTDQQLNIVENVVYLSEDKRAFHVNQQSELDGLVKALAKERSEIAIVEAAFTELQDSQGTFKAIVAKYHVNDELTQLVVPLVEHNASMDLNPKNATVYAVGECEMKCTSAWGCQECTQEIIERCKKQKCSCTSGSGGCSSKTTFLSL